ncbi:type VI secretion system-associated FHA domain protein TagH [Paraburkholderia flagellata]|uniref:type VI secretion system-associated FHA domain protein TagH n=1 Tax=Paraburkholderia flagellata TaxID=2883241 RepID=UPI001F19D636|nr:type VI secretion system-associated FHA domain protein TagH [Paraburkholderia flagellata]
MLTLTVIRFNGTPPSRPLAATFDTAGGTIGRAGTNQLVLEDAERTVSRVHAQIVWRDGHYRLIDRGSNPAIVNGTPLEPGEEIAVKDGDEVQIGGYQLRAAVADTDPTVPSASDDPFAGLFGEPQRERQGAHDADGLDDLLRPSPREAEALPRTATPPPILGDDFDLGIEDPAANRTIDELFNLGPGSDLAPGSSLEARDSPLRSASPIDDPLAAPNTSRDSDPFASLTATTKPDPPPPSQPDSSSELHSAFPLPRMRPAPQAEPAPPQQPPPADASQRPAQAAPSRAHPDALLDALLRGLDAPAVRIDSLTPALMQLLGELLREATQGTLDMLRARAATRREMRTEATMIVASDNNPLKFSPNVEAALAHLLNPATRGFMPATEALADAYADLRAHQVGFVAGMRAALDGVFDRFEPAKIEARLTQHSLLDNLLPQLNRRARCWDLFSELHGQLTREAADDFHALFGKAFVAAYEAQIDRLKQRKS